MAEGGVITVAALYVDVLGPYPNMPDVESWGLPYRDARQYAGPWRTRVAYGSGWWSVVNHQDQTCFDDGSAGDEYNKECSNENRDLLIALRNAAPELLEAARQVPALTKVCAELDNDRECQAKRAEALAALLRRCLDVFEDMRGPTDLMREIRAAVGGAA